MPTGTGSRWEDEGHLYIYNDTQGATDDEYAMLVARIIWSMNDESHWTYFEETYQ